MNDWYEIIEQPIRELVKQLRNNGINTTSSCGHEMYVQVDLYPDAQLKTMHEITYNWLAERENPINYTITINLAVDRGILSQCWAEIRILNASTN